MLELNLKRLWPVPDVAVTGVVESDGKQLFYSLEDPVREIDGLAVAEWKIDGETAIPRGHYRVTMDWSNRFGKLMPHVLDVPGFTGIRFHGGNRAKDVIGCIAVGEKHVDDQTIADCAPALEALISLIEQALANDEEVWLTVA